MFLLELLGISSFSFTYLGSQAPGMPTTGCRSVLFSHPGYFHQVGNQERTKEGKKKVESEDYDFLLSGSRIL